MFFQLSGRGLLRVWKMVADLQSKYVIFGKSGLFDAQNDFTMKGVKLCKSRFTTFYNVFNNLQLI